MAHHETAEIEAFLKTHVLARLIDHFNLPHSVVLDQVFDIAENGATLLYLLRLERIDFGGWQQDGAVYLYPVQFTEFMVDEEDLDSEVLLVTLEAFNPTLELLYQEVTYKSLGWPCLEFTDSER